MERATVLKMKAFLHELGCQALVTNANAWTNHTSDQLARAAYDYVDDHFYIDHPRFIEQSLAVAQPLAATAAPSAGGASGGGSRRATRLPACWTSPSPSPNSTMLRRGATAAWAAS